MGSLHVEQTKHASTASYQTTQPHCSVLVTARWPHCIGKKAASWTHCRDGESAQHGVTAGTAAAAEQQRSPTHEHPQHGTSSANVSFISVTRIYIAMNFAGNFPSKNMYLTLLSPSLCGRFRSLPHSRSLIIIHSASHVRTS